MGNIYFKTKAYNAEKTISKCIESVLNQTKYGDKIIYYICDNGSTDRTGDIIKEYAQKDKRIKVSSNKTNNEWCTDTYEFSEFTRTMSDEDYLCVLDADDYYDIFFLEKIIPFAQKYDLDIAACGTEFIDEKSQLHIGERRINNNIIIKTHEEFMFFFPLYHQFMRAEWGKIFKGNVARYKYTNETQPLEWEDILYGGDTLNVFSMLTKANSIGIINDICHHYLYSAKSGSYVYDKKRFFSDEYLYKDSLKYLQSLGNVSNENISFISEVFCNALIDTVKIIENAHITDDTKLKELESICTSSTTSQIFSDKTLEIDEGVLKKLRKHILLQLIEISNFDKSNDDFDYIVKKICPSCSAILKLNGKIFLSKDPSLLDCFIVDDTDMLMNKLLSYIKKKQYIKQFDIDGMIKALAHNNAIIQNISNILSFNRYTDVVWHIWKRDYLKSLNIMNDLLEKSLNKNEDFYNTYLCLASIENRPGDFVKGKISQTEYYYSKRKYDKCLSCLQDLSEMGVDNNEIVKKIKSDIC